MIYFRALFSIFKIHYKISFSRNLYKFSIFIMPIFFSTLLYFIYSGREMVYIIWGSGIASLWGLACYSSAIEIERERLSGTLEAVSVTSIRFEFIIFSKILANTLIGFISFAIVIIYSILILRIPLIISRIDLFLLSLFSLLLSLLAISFLTATLFTLSRNAFALMSSILYPIYFISGILFPVEILPSWVQYISTILPIRWSVSFLKNSVQKCYSIEKEFYYSILLSILYILIGHFLFKYIERKNRKDATFGGI